MAATATVRVPACALASADPEEAAREAGLRYVRGRGPGIRRQRDGDHFAYIDPDGKPVQDAETLARITGLAIPPAWTDAWICPSPRGHIQATGRDAKGRKQYRYHPRWRALRDENKYDRMIDFAEALPAIRARVEHDLGLPGLPRSKVLAAVVHLLEVSHIRVGNDEYARQNHSFGLTTLENRHVDVSSTTVRFHFRGKSGKQHDVAVHDRRLARVIQRCRDLPGYELFQYGDGKRHAVDSGDVNDYLREITGQGFSAKDFRTWSGTVLAARALRDLPAGSEAEAKKHVVRAIESVAEQLGNTPAVCRACYVHPAVIETYLGGCIAGETAQPPRRRSDAEPAECCEQLLPEEASLLAVLRRWQAGQETPASHPRCMAEAPAGTGNPPGTAEPRSQ